MSTSEHDVLEAMDRAAMDAPPMALAAGSVLAGGKARVRRRRAAGAGMSLAAAVLAVTVWVGLGPASDTAVQDLAPADDTASDQEAADWTTDLDGPLATPGLPGFTDASIERGPGDEHFTVRVPDGDGWVELERVEADLPAGVDLFHNAGYSLVLTPEVHPGVPTLYLQPKPIDMEWQQTTAGRGEAQVPAWWVDGTTRAEDITDVYWVSEDEMLAASGTEVVDADVEVDGVRARVSIVPELDVWVDRADRGDATVSPVGTVQQPQDGVAVPESVLAVVPGAVRDVQASGTGVTVDGPVPVELPMVSTAVGDYSVAAASLAGADLPDLDGTLTVQLMSWTEGEGQTRSQVVGPMVATGDALPDGTVRVGFNAIDDEVVFDPQSDEVVATPAGEGGWIVIATPPDGSSGADSPLLFLRTLEGEWPSGPVHQQSGTVEGAPELVWFTVATDDAYSRSGRDQRVLDDDDLEVDVLFDSGVDGPWWGSGDKPARVSLADTAWHWSVQEDLGMWAVRCTAADEGVWGELSSVDFDVQMCGSTAYSDAQDYLVSVLPTDVARRAVPVLRDEPGVTPEAVEWDEPQIADLGSGRSLVIARQIVGPTTQAGAGLVGLDIDGDGKADDSWD